MSVTESRSAAGERAWEAHAARTDERPVIDRQPDTGMKVREESGVITVLRGDNWLCRARARMETLPARQAWTGARLLLLDEFAASEPTVLEADGRGALPPLRELLRSTTIGRDLPWHVLRVDARSDQDAVVGAAWRFALERHMTCDVGWSSDHVVSVTIYGRGVRATLASAMRKAAGAGPVTTEVSRRLVDAVRSRSSASLGRAQLYALDLSTPHEAHCIRGLTFRPVDLEDVSRRPLLYADTIQGVEFLLGRNDQCFVGELHGRVVFRMWVGAVEQGRLDGVDPEMARKPCRYLHDGHTLRPFRNLGIRTAALRWLAPQLYDNGYELLWAHILPDNLPSIRSAEKAGFRHVTELQDRISYRAASSRMILEQGEGLKLDGAGVLDVVREVLAVAGTVRVRAAGTSMWPTIPNGSLVTLVPIRQSIGPGDIVLLNWAGKPVLHRVVKVDGEVAHTMGDACVEPDPPTPIRYVLAKATAVSDHRGDVTLDGSLSHGLRSWSVFAVSRGRLGVARRWRWVRARLTPTSLQSS